MLSEINQQESQIPTLIYYKIRGIAQPIRNLLYYLKVQFNDYKLQKNSPQVKSLQTLESTFDSGLPKFHDSNIKISDAVAISYHICNNFNGQSLLGKNPLEKAKINEVLFKYWTEKNKIIPGLVEVVFSVSGIPEVQKVKKVREMLHKMVKSSKFITYCLKMHELNDGWILKNKLSLIDFFFYETAYYVNGFFEPYISKDDSLNIFISFCKKFQQLSFHIEHQPTIKQTKVFFPFNQHKKNEIIISAWQTQDENIIQI